MSHMEISLGIEVLSHRSTAVPHDGRRRARGTAGAHGGGATESCRAESNRGFCAEE